MSRSEFVRNALKVGFALKRSLLRFSYSAGISLEVHAQHGLLHLHC